MQRLAIWLLLIIFDFCRIKKEIIGFQVHNYCMLDATFLWNELSDVSLYCLFYRKEHIQSSWLEKESLQISLSLIRPNSDNKSKVFIVCLTCI